MSKLGYKVTTGIVNDCIKQKVTYTGMDNIARTMAEDVSNTKEKQFISALIKLGWMPPDGRKTNKAIRKRNVNTLKTQTLVKCKVCKSVLPSKPFENNNGFMKTPIVHTHWLKNRLRGLENVWCPGGGI